MAAASQLQLITAYSLLKSTNRIPELVSQAKNSGYTALGIADINVMYGVVEFYKECQRQGIHPLIGLTIEYTVPDIEEKVFSLVLHAKNDTGYRNLLKISTAKMENPDKNSFTLEDFYPWSSDIIVTIPGSSSQINYYLTRSQEENAIQWLDEMGEKIDKGCLFGGIPTQESSELRKRLTDFYHLAGTPITVLNAVKYLHPSDHFSVEVLAHIEEGTKLESLEDQKTGSFYLPEADRYRELCYQLDLDEAFNNSNRIADLCQFEMNFSQTLLPHYDTPEGLSSATYLRKLCFDYLPERVKAIDERYSERLEKELSIIHQMGFDDYFLIIWDVMRFTAEQNIVTGAGRGSAAGSLVSYVLSITDVDPIKYNLLFERFLNIERNTMPDIDLDIPDNRRDEVLHYVFEKYGHHHMAQIATFGTMAAKMVLRDICRVFGLSQSEANLWSNAVPNVLKITLSEAYEQSKKLQHLVSQSERNQLIFDLALKLEGLPRHVSTHAAGVVISDHLLTDVVPLQEGTNNIPLTQFTMGDVEAVGLLKMDFLGLRNLSIIDDTLRKIRQLTGKKLSHRDIPMDNPETLDLFKKGQTMGVFQFESNGIRNVLRRVSPESIEDIAAVNALYRPGPMQNIDLFVKRKRKEVPIDYPHVSLKDILDVTYGIIVYQEQIMQVAAKMAGFTLGQADILQRAISKKVKSTIDEQKQNFIQGSIAQGYSQKVAEEVYQYIERFANYGFNRSHAMAYSFVGYQMAYLKVHYPAPFFASLLHSVRHNLKKIKEYISDAKKYGLTIKGPDINRSGYSFTLKNDELLFGFSSLKGIRRDFIRNLIDERELNGPYKSLDNFLIRIDNRWLKEDIIAPLIKIGAFDQLEPNRRQLVTDLDGNIKNIVYSGGSMDLLEILSLKKDAIADYSVEEKLAYEEELLGTYFSGHPVDHYETLKIVKGVKPINSAELGKRIVSLVYVKEVRQIRTKRGEQMAFLRGSDETSDISVTVFPDLFREVFRKLEENQVFLVAGKFVQSNYNQELQILAEELRPARDFEEEIGRRICYLKISKGQEIELKLKEIKEEVRKYPGITPVIIFVEENSRKIFLGKNFWVQDSSLVQESISQILGAENVVFQ